MATVSFRGATRYYAGNDTPAVDGLDLEVADGEFLVLVGPSGCGKSTTLRMLAGLEGVDGGEIWIGEKNVTDVEPRARDIAMVFQNYALYPHMTVHENIAFHLKIAKMPKDERDERVREAAKLLDLEQYLDRKPAKLSGGQRQRVATRTDIARLQQDLGVTTVYVTHDQVEAMTMGDRVAVMKLGVLQQVDTPLKLYDKPANLFVAGFIGSPQMNLLEGVAAEDGTVKVGGYKVPVDPTAERKMSGNITVGVRPENWRLVSDGEGGLPVRVTVVEELGADSYVYGTCDVEGVPSNVIVRISGRHHPQKGEMLYVTTDPEHVHVFDTDTGERLSA